MSTIRESKSRRSRPEEERDRAPTERTQVYSHATPAQPRDSHADLAALSGAFGDFFGGLAKATDTMRQAEHQDQLHEIGQENKRQEQQGNLDAMKGAAPDAALSTDLDYMTAYSRTKGISVGEKAAMDYRVELEKQNLLGTDPEAFRDAWFKKQIGDGTGDPVHDAAMLAKFRDQTDNANLAFRVNAAKAQREQGQAALNDEVFSRVGGGTLTSPSDLREVMDRSIALHLGDSVKGRAAVISALTNAATTPGALQRVNTLIHAKGYIDDGTSFAEAFPAAANQISQTAVDKYMKALDAEGFKQYNTVEQSLLSAISAKSPQKIVSVMDQIGEIRSKHGGEAIHDGLMNKARTALDKMAAEITGENNFIAKLNGPGNHIVDQAEINKYQLTVLGRELGKIGVTTPLANEQSAAMAAYIVGKSRGIATDLKDTMSMAMTDRKPDNAAPAYQFWKSLEDSGHDVRSWMSAPARDQYEALKAVLPLAGNNVRDALGKLAADPEAGKKLGSDPKSWEWNVLMGRAGDPPAQVRAETQTKLHKTLAGVYNVTNAFGFTSASKLAMSDQIGDEIMTTYGRQVMSLRAFGHPDAHEKALEIVKERVKSDYWTVPGVDGSMQLIRRDGIPRVGANGQPVIGPGVIKGPLGEENTVDNFASDMKVAQRWLPGIFNDPSALHVAYDRTLTSQTGTFRLMESNTMQPLRVRPGQELALSEGDGVPRRIFNHLFGLKSAEARTLTLPADPVQAQKDLESILPPYIKVTPRKLDSGTYFEFGYQFHAREAEDIDSLATRYDMQLKDMTLEARQAYEARQSALRAVSPRVNPAGFDAPGAPSGLDGISGAAVNSGNKTPRSTTKSDAPRG